MLITLISLCKRVKIYDDIISQKNGFNTLISEVKGFSYGQKKKMLLAKAFLKPCEIMLLDEPLSGIDENSQNDIAQTIREMAQSKIVIIATHNVAFFDFADEVITLK